MNMKKTFYAVLAVFTLSLFFTVLSVLPVLAAEQTEITPEQIDSMAIDPQNWKLQRDMTWQDLKPHPVIDWSKELNTKGLTINTSRLTVKERKIKGALILVDYLDKKFISGQKKGSDPLGYKRLKTALVGEDGKLHGSYEEAVTKNPVVSILDYPSAYANGYADLPKFWTDYLNVPNTDDPKKPINNGATVDKYWLENSYGKWGTDLTPLGVYTVPYFEFELQGYGGFQTWRDVPPSFRYGTPNDENPSMNGPGTGPKGNIPSIDQGQLDNHAVEVAKRGGVKPLPNSTGNPWGVPDNAGGLSMAAPTKFDDYDFFFILHAGYDESGAWQEFGQLQFKTRQDIPWDLGPGSRLLQVEKFFNDHPEWVPIYAARYKNGWGNYKGTWRDDKYNKNDPRAAARVQTYKQVAFWEETLASWKKKYDSGTSNYDSSATFEFKLPQEDWDWANAYHGKKADEGRPGDTSVDDGLVDYVGLPHVKNTRYVAFTSWESAVSEWSHSSSKPASSDVTAYSATGATKVIPYSSQGENDGMGTFAHEFGHIASISDNYSNPWERKASPLTEPWELMSRGSFAGPFGDHARWSVMPIEGSSSPTLATHGPRTIWNYFDEGDLIEISVDVLAAGSPVIANVAARNVPLTNGFYPNLGVPRYDSVSGLGFVKGMRLNFDTAGDFADKAAREGGYTNFHSLSASGNAGAARRMSVEVVERTGNDSFTHDSGVMLMRIWNLTNAGFNLIDSHLYDISMTDYFLDGKPSGYPIGHATQLADALFKAGKSFTDTGYYADIKDTSGKITTPGSEWRWEPRNNRPIAGGDSVNEWRDEANKLHFYILSKQLHPAKYGDFLSYRVAVRHDDGAAVTGELSLSVKPDGAAKSVKVGNYSKQTYMLTNTGAVSSDIVRVQLEGKLAEGRVAVEMVDITMRNPGITDPVVKFKPRTLPKPFSEQNAVILNDLYSIAPGETVEFDVYVKQVDGSTIAKLAELLTVKVTSETNPGNYTSLSVNGTGNNSGGGGCNSNFSGSVALVLIAVIAITFLFKKKKA